MMIWLTFLQLTVSMTTRFDFPWFPKKNRCTYYIFIWQLFFDYLKALVLLLLESVSNFHRDIHLLPNEHAPSQALRLKHAKARRFRDANDSSVEPVDTTPGLGPLGGCSMCPMVLRAFDICLLSTEGNIDLSWLFSMSICQDSKVSLFNTMLRSIFCTLAWAITSALLQNTDQMLDLLPIPGTRQTAQRIVGIIWKSTSVGCWAVTGWKNHVILQSET